MNVDQLKQLRAGTFELPLTNCVLRQRGKDSPTIYEGPGLITQKGNKQLSLRMFSHQTAFDSSLFTHHFNRPFIAGQLVPETEYYDLSAIDLSGETWTSSRITIDLDAGQQGSVVRARLWRLEKKIQVEKSFSKAEITTYVPGDIDLAWHKHTDKPNGGWSIDRFEHASGKYSWEANKVDDGFNLRFSVEGASTIEPHFTAFWSALSILTGKALQTVCLTVYEGNSKITRLSNINEDIVASKIIPPIQQIRPNASDAHAFLAAYLDWANSDGVDEITKNLLHRYWHRILRARESDIENSSLVLSVAIEGIAQKFFKDKAIKHPELISQLEAAKALLKNIPIGTLALTRFQQSIGFARTPSVPDILDGLIQDGLIKNNQKKFWGEMRHAAAHGELIESDEQVLQQHVDRYHSGLDLFYRMIFILIGFHGKYHDMSTPGRWNPQSAFPPAPI